MKHRGRNTEATWRMTHRGRLTTKPAMNKEDAGLKYTSRTIRGWGTGGNAAETNLT